MDAPAIAGATRCYECGNKVYRDGYCQGHWQFLFEGMTNHQRMQAKKALREARKAKSRVQ